MQQILSTSYSTSWSAACDSCMFPPEKISPDSSLEGMFVFFICSLYHYRVFLHSFPSLSRSFYDDSLFFRVWSPSPIYISLPLLIFFLIVLSFIYSDVSLLPLSQCSVSCGGGVQTRSIQCLRQGHPAVGCLLHQRPITSRACNTHFCSASLPAPALRPSRVTDAGLTLKGKTNTFV